MIWDALFWKIRVYVDGLVTRNKVFSDSSHPIQTYPDVVVEIIKFHISVSFKFCFGEEFIEFLWDYLMFQSPHATNFCVLSTLKFWSSTIIWDHSGRIWRLWWILLGWRVFQSVNLICDYCKHYFELFCEFRHFIIIVLLVGYHILLVGFNWGLHDDEFPIIIVIHLVSYFFHIEAWGMKSSITEIEQCLWFGAIWSR